MDNMYSYKEVASNDKYRRFIRFMCISRWVMCGAILGCMEQFYNGIMFNIKEFWVRNGMRGQGIGTQIFSEFEKSLKERQVGAIILFTSKDNFTEHFYHKQNMKSNPQMIFMEKEL